MKFFNYKNLAFLLICMPGDAITLRPEVTIHWNELHQKIEGFGTFAGRSIPIYESERRDEILNLLLGENGLRLTILRSTVFPDLNFSLDDPSKSKIKLF